MFYRKKPVVIEAEKLSELNIRQLAEWCGGLIRILDCDEQCGAHKVYCIDIKTLEGIMRANIGDYIIKGIKGEFYPCKPEIFEASYEIAQVRE